MNFLVTGSRGFIGKHLTDRLLKAGHTVYPYSIEDRIWPKAPIDVVIHLAGMAGVRPEKQNAILHFFTNTLQTVVLLDTCIVNEAKRFVYISSSAVYSDEMQVPWFEEECTDFPLNYYGASKKASEVACYTYSNCYGIDVAILRPFTVYGPGQTTKMAIPTFTDLIYKGKPITMFGNTERDYVYVDDCVDAIMAAAYQEHGYAIYNVGSGNPVQLSKLVKMIEERLGKKATVLKMGKASVGEPLITYADTSKAAEFLGFRAKTNIKDGLNEYISWYLEREDKK